MEYSWEEEDWKVNECVAEVQILAKCKNLIFNNSDTGICEKIWSLGMNMVTDGCLLSNILLTRNCKKGNCEPSHHAP